MNTTVQVNATLDVKGSVEQVSVTGSATMVQTTATNLVQVVDERRIVDFPLNGRNVLQLVTVKRGQSRTAAHRVGLLQINTHWRRQVSRAGLDQRVARERHQFSFR